MQTMKKVKKVLSLFHSPALGMIARWSEYVRWRLLVIIFLNVILPVFSLGISLATKGLVDSSVARNMDAIVKYGIVLGCMILIRVGLSFAEACITLRTHTHLQRVLQREFVDCILQKKYPDLKNYHSGELVNRFFSDIDIIKIGIIDVIPSVVYILVSFIGAVAILVSIDSRLIIALIICGIIAFGVLTLFHEPIKRRHRKRRKAEEKLQVSVQETFENIRLIKSSLSEKRIASKINVLQDYLEKAQMKQGIFSIIMNRGIGIATHLSWFICMIWGCMGIFQGRITYGSLAAILRLMDDIESPFLAASGIAGQIYGMITSAERVYELQELPDECEQEAIADFDEIRIDHLSFAYDSSNDDVIHDLTFSIKKGDFTAVTGVSGGGKTSLFQLLLGIYRPISGQILICRGDQCTPASRGTRRLFAYVPQGNSLFAGTLRDNLLLFTDHATDDEIAEAVRCTCLGELVQEIGLDAVIGERGIGLSEGQAQRVAIARALLCKAPIMLLDEATSALDEATEAELLNNLSSLQGKTCLIVTHRRAALRICNHRLHLHQGSLVEANLTDDDMAI